MSKLIKNDNTEKIVSALIIALLALTLILFFIALIKTFKNKKKSKDIIDIKSNFDLHKQEMLNVKADTLLLNSMSTNILTTKP